MIEVGRRDFLHNTEKHIKEGTFLLTRHKNPDYVVTFRKYKEGLEKAREVNAMVEKDDLQHYSCGCVKNGAKLCPKHGRV